MTDLDGDPDVPVDRSRRAELLAAAPAEALVALAERCLDDEPAPLLVAGPEVGLVMMTVREPVAHHRFHLGEVLVTRAEIEFRGVRGWNTRLGEDRLATLAGAVLDAEVEADGPRAADVRSLCAATARQMQAQATEQWQELQATTVNFEELD